MAFVDTYVPFLSGSIAYEGSIAWPSRVFADEGRFEMVLPDCGWHTLGTSRLATAGAPFGLPDSERPSLAIGHPMYGSDCDAVDEVDGV